MLRSNSFSEMNDPRESQPWTMGGVNLPFEKFFADYYNDDTHIDCQFKFGKMVKDRFQVICFSGAQQEGWNNEMMWAHYAEQQMGVCLEFDEEELIKAVKEKFPSAKFSLQPVKYTNEMKEKSWFHWSKQLSDEENFDNYSDILCRKVVFNKSHFWEKEDEKRLLFFSHTQNLFLPYGYALKAIYIGLFFPKHYLPVIEELIDETQVRLYKLIYQDDKYIRWNLTRKEGEWWTSTVDEKHEN